MMRPRICWQGITSFPNGKTWTRSSGPARPATGSWFLSFLRRVVRQHRKMRPLAHSARDGKPPQTYADHVANVIGHPGYGATVNAAQVARYRPRDGQAFIQTVGAAAEYHDLGKLDERNQDVLSRSSKEGLPVNHVDAGVCHLLAEKATRWAALLV